MYSRNRARPEERYAENVPSLYGGSRFYRQEPEIRMEDVRAAAEGTPVQYEAVPRIQAQAPLAEENSTACICESAEEAMPEEPKKPEGPLASLLGEPEELLGTLLWLVDAKASGFVNGVVIPIDGGFAAYSGV